MSRKDYPLVPVDLHREPVMPLDHARHWLAIQADIKPPCLATLRRWANQGIKGVVLETVFVGNKQCVSRESLGRFVAALSARKGQPKPTTARAREIEKAEERAAKVFGVGN